MKWIAFSTQGSQQCKTPGSEEITFLIVQKHHCHFVFIVSSALLLHRRSKLIFCLLCLIGLGRWLAATLAAKQETTSVSQQTNPWESGMLCLHGGIRQELFPLFPLIFMICIWEQFELLLYDLNKSWLGICEREGRENGAVDGERLKGWSLRGKNMSRNVCYGQSKNKKKNQDSVLGLFSSYFLHMLTISQMPWNHLYEKQNNWCLSRTVMR